MAYLPTTEPAIEDDVVIVHCLQLEDSAKLALNRAYAQDNTMHSLKSVIAGRWNWPTKKQVPLSIQPFWNFRDELFVKEDLVYRAWAIGLVIPQSERSAYLKRLHMGHLSMEKCIERAKQGIFWPGINGDIRRLISQCAACLKYSNRQQRLPLHPHEIPTLPWNKVGMDILEFQGHNCLIVVDFFSHFPELRLIKDKTAKDVMGALRFIFAVHGVPVEVIADNSYATFFSGMELQDHHI